MRLSRHEFTWTQVSKTSVTKQHTSSSPGVVPDVLAGPLDPPKSIHSTQISPSESLNKEDAWYCPYPARSTFIDENSPSTFTAPSVVSEPYWRAASDSPSVSSPQTVWTPTGDSESPAFGTPNTLWTTSSQAITLKGSSQGARSNLLRHSRRNTWHNLKCPFPECCMMPPMRWDNLGRHLNWKHKISSRSERKLIIHESKLSARPIKE